MLAQGIMGNSVHVTAQVKRGGKFIFPGNRIQKTQRQFSSSSLFIYFFVYIFKTGFLVAQACLELLTILPSPPPSAELVGICCCTWLTELIFMFKDSSFLWSQVFWTNDFFLHHDFEVLLLYPCLMMLFLWPLFFTLCCSNDIFNTGRI